MIIVNSRTNPTGGLGRENSETGERYISHTEIRTVLILAGEEYRLHTLWQLIRWARADGDSDEKWDKDVPEFLNNAWPLQIAAKSPRITASLCDLAVSDMQKFPERVDLILPLVTTLDHSYVGFHPLVDVLGEAKAKKCLHS